MTTLMIISSTVVIMLAMLIHSRSIRIRRRKLMMVYATLDILSNGPLKVIDTAMVALNENSPVKDRYLYVMKLMDEYFKESELAIITKSIDKKTYTWDDSMVEKIIEFYNRDIKILTRAKETLSRIDTHGDTLAMTTVNGLISTVDLLAEKYATIDKVCSKNIGK